MPARLATSVTNSRRRGDRRSESLAGERLAERLLEPSRRGVGDLGIEHDVEVGLAKTRDVGRRGTHRRGDWTSMPRRPSSARDLGEIVAVAKAERGGTEEIAASAARCCRGRVDAWRRSHRSGQRRGRCDRRSRRRPSFPFLVGRQLKRDDRDRASRARARKTARDRPGSARPCTTPRPSWHAA